MAQNKIHWIAELTVGEGNLQAFKKLADGVIAAIEATGTSV